MSWLLLAGAVLGLALSAWGLLEQRVARHAPSLDSTPSGSLPANAAAIVGDRVIRRIDYERMLAGVEKDLRNPLDDATRRRVLERMIDEELLVQQALALGLAAADRRVRGELVAGLVDSVVADAEGDEPSRKEVEAHYRANAELFARPGRARVEAVFFAAGRDAPARERANEARVRLLAGEPASAVAQRLGDPQVAPVPDSLLPLAKLRDYLGPRVVEALVGLEPGAWSEPIETTGGLLLVRVVERERQDTPPFPEVETLVRRDLMRKRGDEALRRYLDALRERTRIERNESVLPGAAP